MTYRRTHVSVRDDSPAMLTYLRGDTAFLMNEAGGQWSDPAELWRPISAVETWLYHDADGTDLLIDGRHNVNLVTRPVYPRFANLLDRDGKPMRAEIHPTLRTWYVEVER